MWRKHSKTSITLLTLNSFKRCREPVTSNEIWTFRRCPRRLQCSVLAWILLCPGTTLNRTWLHNGQLRPCHLSMIFARLGSLFHLRWVQDLTNPAALRISAPRTYLEKEVRVLWRKHQPTKHCLRSMLRTTAPDSTYHLTHTNFCSKTKIRRLVIIAFRHSPIGIMRRTGVRCKGAIGMVLWQVHWTWRPLNRSTTE